MVSFRLRSARPRAVTRGSSTAERQPPHASTTPATRRARFRRRDWLGGGMAAAALTLMLVALLAPVIVAQDPVKQNLIMALQGPSWSHWLGTDQFGRDMLARILYGLRLTVFISVISVGTALAIGSVLGIGAGYWGGVLDTLIMRSIDVLLAFPSLVLAMIVISILGPGLSTMIVALAVYSVPGFARVGRGEVLRVKHLEFVTAARAIGATDVHILIRHVSRNIYSQLTILATIRLGVVIIVGSSLGFLGLGVSPPTPELGSMLGEGRTYMRLAPQLIIIPGLVISLLVLTINLTGNWARDRWDPHLRRA